MLLRKWLLGNKADAARNGYLWNSIAGFANALQNTIILFVLQRVADEAVSGVFAITFATANLMLTIGKYGGRYYHVSDVKNRFSASDFFTHRIVTSLLMGLASLVFCAYSYCWGGYTGEKTWLCLLLCLQKIVDAMEDVIQAEYQRQGRLDVGGRAMGFRLAMTVASFLMGYIVSGSLVVAAIVALAVAVVLLAVITGLLRDVFPKFRVVRNFSVVGTILRECFPVFLGSFMIMFITNASKYAIDANESAQMQAIYSFISIPLLVVALLAEFLFRPMTTALSEAWNDGKIRILTKKILMIVGLILLLTVICVVGGVTVGIPVMSFLFNTQLRPYAGSMAILLVGSGLLSMTSFMTLMLTIIRKQQYIMWAYLLPSGIALPVANMLVRRMGLMGAAIAYFVTISILCATVVGMVVYHIGKRRREE